MITKEEVHDGVVWVETHPNPFGKWIKKIKQVEGKTQQVKWDWVNGEGGKLFFCSLIDPPNSLIELVVRYSNQFKRPEETNVITMDPPGVRGIYKIWVVE